MIPEPVVENEVVRVFAEIFNLFSYALVVILEQASVIIEVVTVPDK